MSEDQLPPLLTPAEVGKACRMSRRKAKNLLRRVGILQQIGEFGGQPERAANERSLFPFAFSLPEEASIMSRMQALQRQREEQGGKPPHERDDEHLPSDLMLG